jgi:hypothetical protein
MMVSESRKVWIEIAAVAAVSFILYQMNMFILFLIPVQMLALRRGSRGLIYGATLVIGATSILALTRLGRLEDASLRNLLVVLEIGIPVTLLGGIVLADIPWSRAKFASRRIIRLAIVTIFVGVLSIPIWSLISRSDGLAEFFYGQIETMRVAFGMTEVDDLSQMIAITELLSDPEWLAEFAVEVVLRSYLFSYFLLVASSMWIGDFAASKTLGVSHTRLTDFRLSPRSVWLFLGGWALVLADIVMGIGSLRYLAWNAASIMLLLYGIQGVGVLRHFLVSRGVSRGLRVALGVTLVITLIWPGVNLLVLVLVPGLGVSETWIHYRKSVKE